MQLDSFALGVFAQFRILETVLQKQVDPLWVGQIHPCNRQTGQIRGRQRHAKQLDVHVRIGCERFCRPWAEQLRSLHALVGAKQINGRGMMNIPQAAVVGSPSRSVSREAEQGPGRSGP